MKYSILIILFLFVALAGKSQTWDEWMRQKKTQTKYLIQQIAALQVYLEYVQKGYTVASQGLKTIQNIKNGDYKLHEGFLGSLKTVNPKIRQYGKVAAIITMQVRIVKQTKQALKEVKDGGQFTINELGYFKKVSEHLLTACLDNIDELILVMTSNQLEMNDNDRIQQIDKLYIDMQEKLSFSSSFTTGLALLAGQRRSEQVEIDYSKRINGLR